MGRASLAESLNGRDQAHAEDDKRQRDSVEARNEADSAVYRSEKMLKDNADKIAAGEKGKIESAVAGVKEALKGGDAAAIKAASEKLNEAWQTASAELYKDAQAKAQAGKSADGPGPEAGAEAGPKGPGKKADDGPIIDAEVVDEKK
jgi:molecular chaperone DnaK